MEIRVEVVFSMDSRLVLSLCHRYLERPTLRYTVQVDLRFGESCSYLELRDSYCDSVEQVMRNLGYPDSLGQYRADKYREIQF